MAATAEQMSQVLSAMTELNQKVTEQTQQLQTLRQQNQELHDRLEAKDVEIAEITAGIQTLGQTGGGGQARGGPGGGEPRDSIVQKWAPDVFTGERNAWSDWSLKFKSYTGALRQGDVGRWLKHVDTNRNDSARIEVLGEGVRGSSALLHSALIATCQGVALTIVRRAGDQEGLEAFRLLLTNYEPHSKQTTVMKGVGLLGFDFSKGRLLDCLEDFDMRVNEYEKATGEQLSDNMRIGIVIKGMEKGSLKEHMLLHSERCDTYAAFRSEVETLARAQAAAMLAAQPMDIGAMTAGAKCSYCGKAGHDRANCWALKAKEKGKGKGKGKGRNGKKKEREGEREGRK